MTPLEQKATILIILVMIFGSLAILAIIGWEKRKRRRMEKLPTLMVKFGADAKSVAGGFRSFADQLRLLSFYNSYHGKADPEFGVLKLMRWPWPTWRVTTRPFDWRND